MDVQAARHKSMQVSDACVVRALCGRIAVGSCACSHLMAEAAAMTV